MVPRRPRPLYQSKTKIVPANLPRRFLRRSRRQDGPVEPDDVDDDEDEADSSDSEDEAKPVTGGSGDVKSKGVPEEPLFGIGDDEADSPTQSPGKGR